MSFAIAPPFRFAVAEMQPGDVKETYADIEASRRDLGFEPKEKQAVRTVVAKVHAKASGTVTVTARTADGVELSLSIIVR